MNFSLLLFNVTRMFCKRLLSRVDKECTKKENVDYFAMSEFICLFCGIFYPIQHQQRFSFHFDIY